MSREYCEDELMPHSTLPLRMRASVPRLCILTSGVDGFIATFVMVSRSCEILINWCETLEFKILFMSDNVMDPGYVKYIKVGTFNDASSKARRRTYMKGGAVTKSISTD